MNQENTPKASYEEIGPDGRPAFDTSKFKKKEEPEPQQPSDFRKPLNQFSKIDHVIGVVSGKGGVGKSMVTALLAKSFSVLGKRVGILDADITGPSIPKMYGVHGPATGSPMGTDPIEAGDGTRIMSINLLLEDEEAPVVWRGPMIAGAVTQFWTDVFWGELDVLLVDLPPGTGDVPLTVFQSIPLDGVVIVTSPQELVELVVKKAYRMAGMMEVPVLGVVENFSYTTCPDCGRRIELFGRSRIDETASELGIPVLAKLPLDPQKAALADEGHIYMADAGELAQKAEALIS